jgi:hypothetical protein
MKARFYVPWRDDPLEGEVIYTGKVQRRRNGKLAPGKTDMIHVQVDDEHRTVYSLRADRDDWEEIA